jgi:hypothetical protein
MATTLSDSWQLSGSREMASIEPYDRVTLRNSPMTSIVQPSPKSVGHRKADQPSQPRYFSRGESRPPLSGPQTGHRRCHYRHVAHPFVFRNNSVNKFYPIQDNPANPEAKFHDNSNQFPGIVCFLISESMVPGSALPGSVYSDPAWPFSFGS